VLHLDSRDYYGGNQASLPISNMVEWGLGVIGGGQGIRVEEESTAELNDELQKIIMEKFGVPSADLVYEVFEELSEGMYGGVSFTKEEEEDAYNEILGIKFPLPPYPESFVQHPALFGYKMEKLRWRSSSAAPDDESILNPVMFGYDRNKRITPPLSPLRQLLSQSRNTSLDLSPRLMLCQGTLVEFLVRSGVSQYLEFKALEASYILHADKATDELDVKR
jgi:RAB protein geranylgeranyltransferase component A